MPTKKDLEISIESQLEFERDESSRLPEKHYGYYQLCPKCDGEGKVIDTGALTRLWKECPVCNGAKLIPRPEIKNV